jgi:hypothetical protein
LADHGHGGGVAPNAIGGLDVASCHHRNAHRTEVVGSDLPNRHVALEREDLRRAAFDGDGLLGSAFQRQVVNGGGRSRVGQRGDLGQELVDKAVPAGLVPARNGNVHCENARGLETGVCAV